MFTGEHERQLDEKGRLVLPPGYRASLADGAYLSCPSGTYLLLVDQAEMDRAGERLRERVRAGEISPNAERRWSASINEVRIDSQGRITIPPKLRDAAGLDVEVVLIGIRSRAEIWPKALWAQVAGEEDDEALEGLWL